MIAVSLSFTIHLPCSPGARRGLACIEGLGEGLTNGQRRAAQASCTEPCRVYKVL